MIRSRPFVDATRASPAHLVNVHSSHESRHPLARFRGTFMLVLFVSFVVSLARIFIQYRLVPVSPRLCVIRFGPALSRPSRSAACVQHILPFSLSHPPPPPFLSPPTLRPRVPSRDRDPLGPYYPRTRHAAPITVNDFPPFPCLREISTAGLPPRVDTAWLRKECVTASVAMRARASYSVQTDTLQQKSGTKSQDRV